MTLVRWTPRSLGRSRDLLGIQDEMNRMFDSFFGPGLQAGNGAAFVPAVDIVETPEGFLVHCDLPGLDPKDVKVQVVGDTVTIRGERRQDSAEPRGDVHRVERVHGAFERSFTLGSPVSADKVKATYRNGVLEVVVPKAENARPKEVEIQIAS